jgi:hypothetical protein
MSRWLLMAGILLGSQVLALLVCLSAVQQHVVRPLSGWLLLY